MNEWMNERKQDRPWRHVPTYRTRRCAGYQSNIHTLVCKRTNTEHTYTEHTYTHPCTHRAQIHASMYTQRTYIHASMYTQRTYIYASMYTHRAHIHASMYTHKLGTYHHQESALLIFITTGILSLTHLGTSTAEPPSMESLLGGRWGWRGRERSCLPWPLGTLLFKSRILHRLSLRDPSAETLLDYSTGSGMCFVPTDGPHPAVSAP